MATIAAAEEAADLATRIAARLAARGQTLCIAESAAGGLISAALLAVPGASAFFLGGGVIYTRASREALLGILPADMTGLRPSTEAYAGLMAGRLRERLAADWALAETGAAGPAGNRYGDAAGHACFAVAGPAPRSATLETGLADRADNMTRFAAAGLRLLAEAIGA